MRAVKHTTIEVTSDTFRKATRPRIEAGHTPIRYSDSNKAIGGKRHHPQVQSIEGRTTK
jgi:hypothetical protein